MTNICDLIEFATGDPATNPWAKIRAEMGHPAPFALHYVGIGNENWDKPFFDRFPLIASKVKALYPNVMIVSSSGPNVDEGRWERAWEFMTKYGAEILDEHYYRPPDWFLKNANRYDTYSRTAPKVYAGEYACHEKGRENSLHSAICEAAMMCGFERNCDVVRMSSYAPLFNNLDAPGYHWRPDMIWFDKTRVFGTPNYYVQKLFATNRPDVTVPVKAGVDCATAFWSVGQKLDGTTIVKLVNAAGEAQPIALDLALPAGTLTVETVTDADPNAVNTIDDPERVTIKTTTEAFAGGSLTRELAPWSATVLKLAK